MTPPRTVFAFVPMAPDSGKPPGVYRFHMEAGAPGACGVLVAQTSDPFEGADIARNLTDAYAQGLADARAAVRLALGLEVAG